MEFNTMKRELIAAMTMACLTQTSGLIAEEKRASSDQKEEKLEISNLKEMQRSPKDESITSYLLLLLKGGLEDSAMPIL